MKKKIFYFFIVFFVKLTNYLPIVIDCVSCTSLMLNVRLRLTLAKLDNAANL